MLVAGRVGYYLLPSVWEPYFTTVQNKTTIQSPGEFHEKKPKCDRLRRACNTANLKKLM